MKTEETERVLLIGGPFHFRTCWIRRDAHTWYFPLLDERPLSSYGPLDEWDPVPVDCDLKVATYRRHGFIGEAPNEVHGAIFKYSGSR